MMHSFKPVMVSLFTAALFFVLTACPAAAQQAPIQVKLDAGYFLGMASDWTDVYDAGGYEAGLEGSYRVLDWLRVFAGVSYMTATGEAVARNDFPYIPAPEASFTLTSGMLGVDYIMDLGDSIDVHAGLGAAYLMWSEEYKDDIVTETYDGSNLGYLIRLGGDYFFSEALSVGLQLQYLMSEFDVDDSAKAYLGDTREFTGLSVTFGVGYSF